MPQGFADGGPHIPDTWILCALLLQVLACKVLIPCCSTSDSIVFVAAVITDAAVEETKETFGWLIK